MKTSELLTTLRQHPHHHLNYILPDGGMIPVHAHITEVGRVDKTFLDCGATVRKISTLSLQAWVADDVDHRFTAGKLGLIIERAAAIIGADDLPVEIEYEDGLISQFPVETITSSNEALLFHLGTKHTDCMAKDICLPPANEQDGNEDESCCSGTGCC
jgi:hypothetical protein